MDPEDNRASTSPLGPSDWKRQCICSFCLVVVVLVSLSFLGVLLQSEVNIATGSSSPVERISWQLNREDYFQGRLIQSWWCSNSSNMMAGTFEKSEACIRQLTGKSSLQLKMRTNERSPNVWTRKHSNAHLLQEKYNHKEHDESKRESGPAQVFFHWCVQFKMANGSLSLALSGYCLESSNRCLISATSSHLDVWHLFMACENKQKGMLFHQEGAPTSATAPAGSHPSACLVVPKLGEASEGGMERSTHVTSEEADVIEANMYPSKEGIGTPSGFPAVKYPTSLNPHPDNLSPDIICKGIRVMLDNNSMWNEYFRCKTEMILTKQGSRMFPYCRFRISGLQPSKKYCLVMDIQPLDNSHYKWTGKSWQVAGKAECQVKSKPFAHPESPSTGQHWMQNPVSFYKLKLTNNISEQEGNTILHPMHRYSPRLHVVQTDKAAKDIKLNGPCVVTFSFPQTEFMAVTAYQNSRFAQLKVDYNPFAKGLKEDGSSSVGLKLKLNSGKDLHKAGGTTTNEHHPVKDSLKCLLANHKPRSSKAMDSKLPASGDLQNSTTSGDQSAAQVPEQSLW